MSYSDYQKSISRRKIRYVVIKGAKCNNTFGTSPCTATGEKCYNTFVTCKDIPNFNKGTKDYYFIDHDLPVSVLNSFHPARPYIKEIDEISNEIKEKNTVVKRVKISLYDETDNDVGIDPYVNDRTSIQGTFWRKWLARNPNYKGLIIEVYEGFEGLVFADFELKFVGKIKNITLSSDSVVIEASDLLRELGEIEYPLILPYTLTEELGMHWNNIQSDNEMYDLDAEIDDTCKRTDFIPIENISASFVSGAIPGVEGGKYWVYTYDLELHNIHRNINYVEKTQSVPNTNTIRIQFDIPAELYNIDAELVDLTYALYKHVNNKYYFATNATFTPGVNIMTVDDNENIEWQEVTALPLADRYYKKNGNLPHQWAYISDTTFRIYMNGTDLLNSLGFIQLGKEIIGYGAKYSTYIITGLQSRGLYNTEPARHVVATSVKFVYKVLPTNPFFLLKAILIQANINTSYIDDSFDDYRDSWSGPSVSCEVLIKPAKLSDLFFDLVNVLDCICWVGEDGKIYIRKQEDYTTPIKVLTDNANIVLDSFSRDSNEASRFTRWVLFWDRFDIEKGINDREAFNKVTVNVDVDLEGTNNFGEVVEDINYTIWLNNENTGTATYIDDMLVAKELRTRQAQTFLTFQVELKDGDIQLGEIIQIITNKEQSVTGEPLSGYYRVVKKTPKGANKIELKVILYPLIGD